LSLPAKVLTIDPIEIFADESKVIVVGNMESKVYIISHSLTRNLVFDFSSFIETT
jgi:hypothetical protein